MTQEQYADAYSRGFDVTRRFLVSRGVSGDTAEEAAQAAWARGWECRDQLRDPKRLVTWVNTIALNLFRNWFRRRETSLRPEHQAPPHMCFPKACGQASLQAIDIGRALASCAPDDREVIEKHYLAGYTSAELGQQKGCTAGAVRIRLLRARRRIRATIAE